ncbi:MAG TPA: hypothetical protein VE130_17440 [Nitrososphaeraceae archaeon]|jgi:hypothetical protein|nr:hypothetical protein [Nitrososphaeraceae archaeon]
MLTELQENNIENVNLLPQVKQEDLVLTNGILEPQTNTSIDYNQNGNEMQAQAKPTFKIVFDAKDLFGYQQE